MQASRGGRREVGGVGNGKTGNRGLRGTLRD